MANGDIIQFSIAGFQGSTETVNTWHYKDESGGATVWYPPTCLSDFNAFCYGTLQNCLRTDWNGTAIRFACIAGPNAGMVGYDDINGTTGVIVPTGTEGVPPEICISIKRSTGFASRHDRGRLFLGPVDPSLLTSPTLGIVDQTNASLIALTGIGYAIFTTMGVGLTPVLVNKTTLVASRQLIQGAIAEGTVHRRKRRSRGVPV